MYRALEQTLKEWKGKPSRKPLLLDGMRQVGKTWLLRHFGRTHFQRTHYFNLDREPLLCDVFKKSKNPSRILMELSLYQGQPIDPETELLVFDEIQECNEALNALKYFCEESQQYFVAAAGSYLGIALSQGASFPVGKVEHVTLYPMTFKEFLLALGEAQLVSYLESIETLDPLPLPLFDRLTTCFRMFYVVGGMPEAVGAWVEKKDFDGVSKIEAGILNAYRSDFSKHTPRELMPKILDIWDSIVFQLSRENKKFKYSIVKKNARAREYETSLNWLVSGRYFTKVHRVNNTLLPLTAYADPNRFKVYLSDVGLLRQKADLDPAFLAGNLSANIPFRGVLAENLALQEILAANIGRPYYWVSKSNHELDFLVQIRGRVVPIEVKFGTHTHSPSFKRYMKTHPEAFGVVCSMRNLRQQGNVCYLPLFMVSELKRLVGAFS
jgi:hypothetical protein